MTRIEKSEAEIIAAFIEVANAMLSYHEATDEITDDDVAFGAHQLVELLTEEPQNEYEITGFRPSRDERALIEADDD